MLTILWSDKFSINITEIDNQHRRLFELIDRLNKIVHESGINSEVITSLDELIDYTKYHFLSEENVMKEEDYPKYNMHKTEHDKLTQQAIDYRLRVIEGKPLIRNEFLEFLFTWLTKHIMNHDKKIGTFLQMKKLQK
jgi:hemerythrin